MKEVFNIKQWKAILFSFVLISTLVFSEKYTDPFLVPKEFFLFFFTGIFITVICITIFNTKKSFKFSLLDLFILTFLIWNIISLIVTPDVHIDNTKLYVYLCCAALFFSMRIVLKEDKEENFSSDVIISVLLIIVIINSLWGLFQFFGIIPNIQKGFKIGGSLGNPGQYTNLLIPVFSYSLACLLFSFRFRELSVIATIILTTVVLVSGQRTAWISTLFVSVFLTETKYGYIKSLWKSIRYNLLRFAVISFLIISIIIVSFYLYNLKRESASGRVFIWRTSISMIKDKPLFGFGFDRFSAAHNDYQANYFNQNNYHENTIYLADNARYAFNEFIHSAVETGIPGAILLTAIFIAAFLAKKKKDLKNSDTYFYGSKAAVLAILISSMFSYPLQTEPSLLLFFFSLGIISFYSDFKLYNIKLIDQNKKFILILIIGFSMVFIKTQLNRNKAEKTWFLAYLLMRENNFYEAYSLYTKLYPELKHNKFFLFNYGAELTIMNRFDESKKILKEAETRLNDADLHIYQGINYESTGNLTEAENCFTKAMNIMPGKLLPRYKLVYIYARTNRNKVALDMAKKILNMKVKVKSETTEGIIKEMKDFVNKNR